MIGNVRTICSVEHQKVRTVLGEKANFIVTDIMKIRNIELFEFSAPYEQLCKSESIRKREGKGREGMGSEEGE